MSRRRLVVGNIKARVPHQCPNAADHTVSPEGYLDWHHWAERMATTHRQRRCPGCGRWSIWTVKR